ncbi:MAG: helix-turn-helix domain-containing protein [Firmicutes bacterium]|nr:helix-turn-helix domain-containing protein [Bacillota bacterium]
MSTYFSEKFKKLRKAQDLTQDQVADIFHVSPQSVSRWETGANYPDIGILPHIAAFFKVTVDELLGTEEILSEKKVGEYVKDIRNLLNSGKVYDAINLARKAVKEYPSNTYLQFYLVETLSVACNEDTPGYEENIQKYKDEIIALSERIINLTDYKSSLKHRYQLIKMYAKWGIKEEAKKLLDTLPDEIWESREPWAELVLDGEEWVQNQRHCIIRAYYLLSYYIGGYVHRPGLLDPLQQIQFLNGRLQIQNILHPITSNAPNHLELAIHNMDIAELYCEIGDRENALVCIETATQDSLHHTDQMDKTNEDDGGNYMAWSTPRNLPWILWEDYLVKPKFDIIRNDERFTKCFDLLKANSKELR